MGYTESQLKAFIKIIKTIELYDTSYEGWTYFQDNLKYNREKYDPLSSVAKSIDSCIDPYAETNAEDFDLGIESGQSFDNELVEVMKQLKDKFYFSEKSVSAIMDCFYKAKATDFFNGFSMAEDIKNWDYSELINDPVKASDRLLAVRERATSDICALRGSDRKNADKLVDMYAYSVDTLSHINGENELDDVMRINFYRSCKPVLDQLKNAKTLSNSDEYKDIITKFENLMSGDRLNVFGENSKENMKKQFNEICELTEQYILHKAKRGVKDNAIPKLDAVIDLYRHSREQLSKLGVERNIKNIDSKDLEAAFDFNEYNCQNPAQEKRNALLALFKKKVQLDNPVERISVNDLIAQENGRSDKKISVQKGNNLENVKNDSSIMLK